MRCRIERVDRLTAADRRAMWALFEATYAEVTEQQFLADLAAKRHALILRAPTIMGFSTATWEDHTHAGRSYRVLYSGDTVLHPEVWGSRHLQKAFGRYMLRVRLSRPWRPAYWLLVSKGYKTYLLLTRNFKDHWPRHDAPTPVWVAGAMAQAARHWFPDSELKSGVLHHRQPQGRLRENVAPPPDPPGDEVAFFLAANPHFSRGDELVCFGRMDWFVLPRYVWKGVRKRWGLSATR